MTPEALDRKADALTAEAEKTAQSARAAAKAALDALGAAEVDEARATQLRGAATALREHAELTERISGLEVDIGAAQQRAEAAEKAINEAEEHAARAKVAFDAAVAAGDVDKATAMAAINRTAPDVLVAQRAALTRAKDDVTRWSSLRCGLLAKAGDTYDRVEDALALAESDAPWPDDERPTSLTRMAGGMLRLEGYNDGTAQVAKIIVGAAAAPLLAMNALNFESQLTAAKSDPRNRGLRPPTTQPRMYDRPHDVTGRR